MPPRRTITLAVAGLLVAPVLTSCSGSGGLDGDWSVGDALAELPVAADGDFLFVRTADLERATELGGLDPDARTYPLDLTRDSGVYAPPPLVAGRFGRDAVVDLADVASFVTLQGGDGVLEVLRVPDAGLPDDGEGAGGQEVRVDGRRVAIASDEETLDAWEDRDDTLAEDEGLERVADLLDRNEVYAAELNRVDPDEGPLRVFGIGQAVEDDEPVEYVVYALGEGDDADEVAEELEDLWGDTTAAREDRIEVDEVDAERDAVAVRILSDDAGSAAVLLQQGEFPFPS